MKKNIITWVALGLSIIALAFSLYSFMGSSSATGVTGIYPWSATGDRACCKKFCDNTECTEWHYSCLPTYCL